MENCGALIGGQAAVPGTHKYAKLDSVSRQEGGFYYLVACQ